MFWHLNLISAVPDCMPLGSICWNCKAWYLIRTLTRYVLGTLECDEMSKGDSLSEEVTDSLQGRDFVGVGCAVQFSKQG